VDYAGAIKAAIGLICVGVVVWFARRIYVAGGTKQELREAKERIEGADEARKAGEEWDAAGGLGGAATRVPDRTD